jgi:hypothetical protein
LISLVFFITKNSLRIYKSETSLFPKTVFEQNKKNFNEVNNVELQLKTTNDGVCFYSKFICSHEIPKNIQIIKIGNYYMFK